VALAKKLKEINGRLTRIAQQKTLEGSSIFDLDREFHRLIVNAGAGPRLNTLHRAIEPQAERYWRLYASSIINNLTASTEEHEAIITSLLACDPDGLEAALNLNWENGCERLAYVIDMFGERGSW
jgi:DNA-binding GntR family transcriptional regulator